MVPTFAYTALECFRIHMTSPITVIPISFKISLNHNMTYVQQISLTNLHMYIHQMWTLFEVITDCSKKMHFH